MKRIMTYAALTAMLLAGGAQAAEHEVKMLNKGDKGAMVFVPDLVKAALFQRFDLLDAEAFFTGLVIGFASIPGSAAAAWLVTRMGARLHVVFMEVLILVGGASMLWHSWR